MGVKKWRGGNITWSELKSKAVLETVLKKASKAVQLGEPVAKPEPEELRFKKMAKSFLRKKRRPTMTLKLDYHLEDRHHLLPSGQKPVWISVEELNMTQICPFLEELTKGFEGETIVISRLNLSIYRKFFYLCENNKWNYKRPRDIIGTETRCLITFGIPSHQNLEELMSRARNLLIIITEEKR